jgi:hypothetical protein
VGRAVVALWVVCAAAIAWVWLRPMGDAPLPEPAAHARRAKKTTSSVNAPLAAPEDEPAAEDPAAAPVRVGAPEMLNRHDLENAIDKVRAKVLQCRDVEQFSGLMTVKLQIARSGNLQSAIIEPPLQTTKTADCVKKALRSLSFPRFRGTYLPPPGTIEWTYPFLFKEG